MAGVVKVKLSCLTTVFLNGERGMRDVKRKGKECSSYLEKLVSLVS